LAAPRRKKLLRLRLKPRLLPLPLKLRLLTLLPRLPTLLLRPPRLPMPPLRLLTLLPRLPLRPKPPSNQSADCVKSQPSGWLFYWL